MEESVSATQLSLGTGTAVRATTTAPIKEIDSFDFSFTCPKHQAKAREDSEPDDCAHVEAGGHCVPAEFVRCLDPRAARPFAHGRIKSPANS